MNDFLTNAWSWRMTKRSRTTERRAARSCPSMERDDVNLRRLSGRVKAGWRRRVKSDPSRSRSTRLAEPDAKRAPSCVS